MCLLLLWNFVIMVLDLVRSDLSVGGGFYMKNFFSAMLDAQTSIYSLRDREAADLYNRLKNCLLAGGHSSIKKEKDIIYSIIVSKMSPREVAQALGYPSDSSYRVALKSLSDGIYGSLGVDFFSLLLGDKESRAEAVRRLQIFESGTKDPREYFLRCVVDDVDLTFGTPEYSFTDCQEEFDFLVRYSNAMYKEGKSSVDASKLRWILRCIAGESGTPDERVKLYDALRVLEG